METQFFITVGIVSLVLVVTFIYGWIEEGKKIKRKKANAEARKAQRTIIKKEVAAKLLVMDMHIAELKIISAKIINAKTQEERELYYQRSLKLKEKYSLNF